MYEGGVRFFDAGVAKQAIKEIRMRYAFNYSRLMKFKSRDGCQADAGRRGTAMEVSLDYEKEN